MFSYRAFVTPVTSMPPARPANAPLTTSTADDTPSTLTRPATRAADDEAPTARTRNPAAVRLRNQDAPIATASAITIPACNRVFGHNRGSRGVPGTGGGSFVV